MKTVEKSIVNEALAMAGDDFTLRLAKLGFKRTKKWYWVRVNGYYADFVHLHRHGSTYGAQINYSISFRVYCGNRAFIDPFDALGLNGPNSDSPEAMERRYHLRFNAKSGSTYARCMDDLERFVIEMGEPWFRRNVPSCDSEQHTENIKLSCNLLGIKVAEIESS